MAKKIKNLGPDEGHSEKKPHSLIKSNLTLFISLFLTILIIILSSYYLFLLLHQNLIYPNIYINGTYVGGKTPQQAHEIISSEFKKRSDRSINLTYQSNKFNLNLTQAAPNIDSYEQVNIAYQLGRSDNSLINFKNQMKALFGKKIFMTNLSFNNPANLTSQLDKINNSIKKEPQDAKVILGNQITIIPATEGLEIDKTTLLSQINHFLIYHQSDPPTNIPTKVALPRFSNSAAQRAKEALENVKLNPLTLNYGSDSLIINQATLFKLLDFDFSDNSIKPTVTTQLTSEDLKSNDLIDNQKLADFLIPITTKVNQEAKDARFNLDSKTSRVTQFQPAQEGREVNLTQTATLITQALEANGSKQITLPVITISPKIASSDVNDLGIKELIGQGVSHFTGSITNRIFNLSLAASRINGVLIAPAEEFSFNKAVGDISGASGYKPAYVIRSGRTVLDDGGGVCQVSTTVFRAALNSGLPITSRTAHAFRVGYYEQGGFPPGLDATIYTPTVDFKFKNDTSSHILVQAYVKDTTLYVDIYGTKDGREITQTRPKILSSTAPPPEVRMDDPTLPKGTVKQVERAAWGANVEFSRTVKKDGVILINEVIKSNFQPWAAVYLVGTKEG